MSQLHRIEAAHAPGRQRGMTLMEIIVVVVIIGLLAAIAVPTYRQYVIRTQRTDATVALLKLATAQEKFYLQNNTYADNDALDEDPPAGLGIDGTENGFYTLAVTAASATDFTATATAIATGPQASDEDCEVFTINGQGVRSATNADGTSNATITAECWR